MLLEGNYGGGSGTDGYEIFNDFAGHALHLDTDRWAGRGWPASPQESLGQRSSTPQSPGSNKWLNPIRPLRKLRTFCYAVAER